MSDFIFHTLHAETGLCNDAKDPFLDFIDDRVEALGEDKKILRNVYVIVDVGLDKALEKLAMFKENNVVDLMSLPAESVHLNIVVKNSVGNVSDEIICQRKETISNKTLISSSRHANHWSKA